MANFTEYDVSKYANREEDIYNINTQITEANEAFTDLNELVEDQQGDFDTLEQHCEATRENVEQGTQEVFKASQYQRAKRKKMCYILICLVVLGGVIAIIILAGH